MADYVRETILCQGYAHIEVVSLTEQQKKDYEVALMSYQDGRAKVILGTGIKPQVRTKDGSLIVHSTVYGSLADALGDIQGDFLKTLNELYVSSKMLADACILESLFLSKAPRRSLVRSESRTGVIKAVKDLFDRVLFIAANVDERSAKKIMRMLDEMDTRVDFVDKQLTEIRDKKLVWKEFHPHLNELPKEPSAFSVGLDKTGSQLYRSKVAAIKKKVSGLAS